MNFKKIIMDSINYESLGLERNEIESLIVRNDNPELGDFSIPCFNLSKKLRKAPHVIAYDLYSNTKVKMFEKVETITGYINFFFKKNPEIIGKAVDSLGQGVFVENIGKQRVVCIDYNSANLGKHMHIGHLMTTMLGESLARLSELFGYKVVRINYIGDYGTPFGKMIVAFKKWGEMGKLENKGADYLQDLYVKFNQYAQDEAGLTEQARLAFSNIENKKGEDYELYKKFVEVSIRDMKDFLSDRLGVKFDSWKGESAYSDLIPEVISDLNKKQLLKESRGSQIVDLEDFGLGVAPIIKTDGASLYIARDIAAAIDRHQNYNFNHMFYVVAVEQMEYFKKLFKILELMGKKFHKGMEHIFFGMISLPSGKISSRLGKQATINDLLGLAEEKVRHMIDDRKFEIESRDKVIKSIAKSTLAFVSLKNDRKKDTVFDPKSDIAFDGDTAPYIMYTYARLKSIIRKHKAGSTSVELNYDNLPQVDMFEIIKDLSETGEILMSSFLKREPAIVARKTLIICKKINKFYTKHRILDGDKGQIQAKINFLEMCITHLDTLLDVLCFDIVDEM